MIEPRVEPQAEPLRSPCRPSGEILAINNEKVIEKLELLLKKEQQELDPVLKEKLTSRALKANEDIKAGRVHSREEADAKLKDRTCSSRFVTLRGGLGVLS